MTLLEELQSLINYFEAEKGNKPDGVLCCKAVFEGLLGELGSMYALSLKQIAGSSYFEHGNVIVCSVSFYIGKEKEEFRMAAGMAGWSYGWFLTLPKDKCGCGADKCGSPAHAYWCDLFKSHGYQSQRK